MRYEDPELIDQLAAGYVLGTLTGLARVRFARLYRERADIRQAVWRWESYLGELAQFSDPVTPPPSIWTSVERRLWPEKAETTGWWNSLGFWRTLSGATAALLLAVGLAIILQSMPELDQQQLGPDHVGFIGEGSHPLWLLSVSLETGELKARAVNAQATEVDQVFELWMLPESGNPMSMGILPVSGQTTRESLPAGLVALLKQSRALAVSIEPVGGSPTGVPTGPVVHTATIVEFTSDL